MWPRSTCGTVPIQDVNFISTAASALNTEDGLVMRSTEAVTMQLQCANGWCLPGAHLPLQKFLPWSVGTEMPMQRTCLAHRIPFAREGIDGVLAFFSTRKAQALRHVIFVPVCDPVAHRRSGERCTPELSKCSDHGCTEPTAIKPKDCCCADDVHRQVSSIKVIS